jgi:hypothetical protein
VIAISSGPGGHVAPLSCRSRTGSEPVTRAICVPRIAPCRTGQDLRASTAVS